MLIALILAACGGSSADTALNCDTMAAVSVAVTLDSSDGQPLAEEQVSYAPPETDGFTPCDYIDGTWLCGYEVAGTITIQAEAACHATRTEQVEVEAGECHVIQQTLELTLEPEGCDD